MVKAMITDDLSKPTAIPNLTIIGSRHQTLLWPDHVNIHRILTSRLSDSQGDHQYSDGVTEVQRGINRGKLLPKSPILMGGNRSSSTYNSTCLAAKDDGFD
jgi:hypothetical protein